MDIVNTSTSTLTSTGTPGISSNALLGILAGTMLIVTYAAGALPILIQKRLENANSGSRYWLSLLSCFSGGVFLATTFLDVVPHIMTAFANLALKGYYAHPFPLGPFMMCVGFLFVNFMEQTIMALLARHAAHQNSSFGEKRQDEVAKGDDASTIHDIVIENAAIYVAWNENHGLVKTITFVFAISFHSLLEGFALGVQETNTAIVSLFLSLIMHKGVEAFSVGLQVTRRNQKNWHFFLTVAIYAIMTPAGIGLGAALQDVLMALLECMACGTFMYVTFLEILAEERAKNEHQNKQLIAITVGFCVISALQFVFEE